MCSLGEERKYNMPNFAEFCAGIGGFRLGLEEVGWNCVYTNEIDTKCENTYETNFMERFNSYDIFAINPIELPDFDVLCAGFPCQSFSIAGKQEGFNDHRGTVFYKLEEIIQVKMPSVIFLENVKNLINHNRGQTFRYILHSLRQLGYNPFFKVLDSSYFGVPQSRPRVYIVAFREDLGIEMFNITERITQRTAFRNFINHDDFTIPITDRWQEYIELYLGEKTINQMSFEVPRTRRVLEKIGPGADLNDCVLQIRSSGIRAISIDQPLPTFAVSNSGGGAMIPVYTGERRHLSLTEIKRIMGFPEDYIFNVSRTDAIKQLANAVCPPVIVSIGQDINNVLGW